jgi:hypothetical protein
MNRWLQIEALLPALRDLPVGDRRICWVVLHHTGKPDHRDWKGDRSAEAVLRYWLMRTKQLGWQNPLGAHFIVSPEGVIYQPFSLAVPVNANSDLQANRRSVSIEVVGDFNRGRDRLEGRQRHAVMGLIGGLLARLALAPEALMFHRDYTATDCPGSSLTRSALREQAVLSLKWARLRVG